MTVMLFVLGASAALELLLTYISAVWRWRIVLAFLVACTVAFAAGGLLATRPNGFTVLLFMVALYRIGNMTRITENRMHDAYLRRAVRRTCVSLLAAQTGILALWEVWHWLRIAPGTGLWTFVALVQLLCAAVLLASTHRRILHTRWPRTSLHTADADLPTVTIAIPARNETEDLEECLQTVIANDYPKLEILVLDDCSQNRRTTDIIRGFAQDGVRFVQGEEPSDTWLPKNQAYARLASEASGNYLLFCGVDVRLGQQSIRQIIYQMLAHKKEMVAILPWRLSGNGMAFTQALRYGWEMVPPRRFFRRPPVLSTCWVISRQLLEASGGFRAVARSITPEAHFAQAAVARDAYSFVRASQASDIASVKSPAEQRATALRTRYPQLHRRPENVLALAAAEIAVLVLPFVMAAFGMLLHVGLPAQVISAVAAILLILTCERLLLTTRTATWPAGIIGVPAGMFYDIWLMHHSMWLYEFSTVDWKGRNVCIPAMHVIPHLPEI